MKTDPRHIELRVVRQPACLHLISHHINARVSAFLRFCCVMPSCLADSGSSLSPDSTSPSPPIADVYPSCPSPPSATFPLPSFLNLNAASSPKFPEPTMPISVAEGAEDGSEMSKSASSDFPSDARGNLHSRRSQTWWNPHRTSPPTQGFGDSPQSPDEADTPTHATKEPYENANAIPNQESIRGQYEVELSPMHLPARARPKEFATNSGLDSCGDLKAASHLDAIPGSVLGSGSSSGSTTDSAPSRYSKQPYEPHVSDTSPPQYPHPLSTEYPFSQNKSQEDLRMSTVQVFRAAEPLPPGVDLPSYLLGERNALEKALGMAVVERGQVAALEATVGNMQSWMMGDVDPGQHGGQVPAQHPSNSETMDNLRNLQSMPGGVRCRQVSALDARLLSIEACHQINLSRDVRLLGSDPLWRDSFFDNCLKQMGRQIAATLLQVDTLALQVASRILLTGCEDTARSTPKNDPSTPSPSTPTPTSSSSPPSKSTQAALLSLSQERIRSQRAKVILGALLMVGGTEFGSRTLKSIISRLPKTLQTLLSPIELGSRLLRLSVWASAFVLLWGESKRGCYQLADSLMSGKGGWRGWGAGGGWDGNSDGGGGAEPFIVQSESVGKGREEGRLKKRKGGEEGMQDRSGGVGGGGVWGSLL